MEVSNSPFSSLINSTAAPDLRRAAACEIKVNPTATAITITTAVIIFFDFFDFFIITILQGMY